VSDADLPSDLGIVGASDSVSRLRDRIRHAAPQPDTVLIMGESGTGKELVAEAIYKLSNRRKKPYVVMNCAALQETLVESELFGHEKGAFTGADRMRVGRFEEANGGTLFLDEVGELSLPVQAKLLRAVEYGQFNRLGSNTTVRVDVRLIAATNQNLPALVSCRTFRADLYQRLRVLSVNLPTLRERQGDAILLANHFLAKETISRNKQPARFAKDALQALERHDWPGNVRELQNAVRRGIVFAPDGAQGVEIRTEHLDLTSDLPPVSPEDGAAHGVGSGLITLTDVVFEALERDEVPLQGLRHKDRLLGSVAKHVIKEFAEAFGLYLATEKGQKRLGNQPLDAVIAIVGLGPKKNLKQLVMQTLFDRLAEVIKNRQAELSPAPDANRRSDRQTPPPFGD
jgi:transcriptional regulator with GAF, ATPase, and Fis domain